MHIGSKPVKIQSIEGMDAVLPHENGTVAVVAVQPNTYGPGAYADDVRFVNAALKEYRPAAVAIEMCRFRAEWWVLQEFGRKELRRLKKILSLEEFEDAFRDLICSAKLADEQEFQDALSAMDQAVPFPNDGAPAAVGARRAELDAVCRYCRGNPDARIWLIDRDARANQPRVEAWVGAEVALGSALGGEMPKLDTDETGRTRVSQLAAMMSPENDRLRKKVINQEREEYVVGELQKRLGGRKEVGDSLVFLLLASTHLEGVIRRWFEEFDDERMAVLVDDQGLGAFQSPDIMEMAMRTQVSWQEALDQYDFFASSPYAGDYEVSTAVEAACDACQEDPVAAGELLASSRLAEIRDQACRPETSEGRSAAARLAELEDLVKGAAKRA